MSRSLETLHVDLKVLVAAEAGLSEDMNDPENTPVYRNRCAALHRLVKNLYDSLKYDGVLLLVRQSPD